MPQGGTYKEIEGKLIIFHHSSVAGVGFTPCPCIIEKENMHVQQFYSSSKANLYLITAANGHKALLECGVKWPKILEAIDFKTDIDFCLLSHSHLDHSVGAKAVMRAGIKLYCSEATAHNLKLPEHNLAIIRDKDLVRCEEHFEVLAFKLHHDCEGILGYIVREKATNEYLFFATDTRTVTQKFNIAFNIIMIELSYNGPYLKKKVDAGEYPEALAKRLLDSHMEQSETMNYLQNSCDLSQCGQVHLLHLSASNVHKQRLVKKFQEQLFIDVVTV